MSKDYIAKHLGGMAFAMVLDEHHQIVMDADQTVGGQDLGPRPKQLLISALAGCTGMDVVSILKKMQVEFTSFQVKAETEMTEEHPKTYSKIHLIYQFTGPELERSRAKFERAIQLSQDRYCGVSAMLSKATTLTYEIRLD